MALGITKGARIGTSSLRRRAQILALRPDLEVAELRGNVDTRLRKLEEDGYDGLVLAAAGLRRLGRAEQIAFALTYDELVPAPGQGALAIEARRADDRAVTAAESITDRGALGTLSAERALVSALDAALLAIKVDPFSPAAVRKVVGMAPGAWAAAARVASVHAPSETTRGLVIATYRERAMRAAGAAA